MAWIMATVILFSIRGVLLLTENKGEREREKVAKSRVLRHTFASRVLPEVLGLVFAKETSGLRLRSRASRELLVEVDDTLHTNSIWCGTDSLNEEKSIRNLVCIRRRPLSCQGRFRESYRQNPVVVFRIDVVGRG